MGEIQMINEIILAIELMFLEIIIIIKSILYSSRSGDIKFIDFDEAEFFWLSLLSSAFSFIYIYVFLVRDIPQYLIYFILILGIFEICIGIITIFYLKLNPTEKLFNYLFKFGIRKYVGENNSLYYLYRKTSIGRQWKHDSYLDLKIAFQKMNDWKNKFTAERKEKSMRESKDLTDDEIMVGMI